MKFEIWFQNEITNSFSFYLRVRYTRTLLRSALRYAPRGSVEKILARYAR